MSDGGGGLSDATTGTAHAAIRSLQKSLGVREHFPGEVYNYFDPRLIDFLN